MRIKLNHQNIFFASDLHLCHANVIKYDGRPFKDVDEMNEQLILNWNSVVGEKDEVFYLGDLSFDRDGDKTSSLVKRLNGKIHFILGNHDDERTIRKLNRFETISDYVNLSVLDSDTPRKKQGIMMMHYPILSWDKAHHGDWHLHGHSHGSLMENHEFNWYYDKKVLDVGCNMQNYTPISYNEVKVIMSEKKIIGVDHH
jgi:calcineurin-like phosphoesterase family protein